MAAGEIRRAVVGRIPDSLRNCVNKEYFANGKPGTYSSNLSLGDPEGVQGVRLNPS